MRLRALFLDHPKSVGETYFQHLRTALSFGVRLAAAAGAVLVHAVVPGLFERTASRIVTALHASMIAERGRKSHTTLGRPQ